MCWERREGRESLRLGRVGQRRGRVKGARLGIDGEEREGRGGIERMEKCGDIAAERMV